MKNEQRGSDISVASSLRTLLFKLFGPEALSSARDYNTDSTLSGVMSNLC